MTETTRRRSSASLLIVAACAILGIITMMVPGITPWSPSSAAAQAQVESSCEVQYLALDPADATKNNPNKEVPGAFGPEAKSFSDEAIIKGDLNERRNCGKDGKFDPALTAAHYVTWSDIGLTTHKVSLADIDSFQAKIAADATLYRSVTDELTKLENESEFSILTGIPAGSVSLYMTPDGEGKALVRSDLALRTGTSAVFTHGDKVVRYRLDCGYQPWWPQAPGELPPPCKGSECVPPPPPPVAPPCTIDCEPYVVPKDPSEGSWQQGNAETGGGNNYNPGTGDVTIPVQPPEETYVPPAPPVQQPPTSTPDPTPPPAPEPEAHKPEAPETVCKPMPGADC